MPLNLFFPSFQQCLYAQRSWHTHKHTQSHLYTRTMCAIKINFGGFSIETLVAPPFRQHTCDYLALNKRKICSETINWQENLVGIHTYIQNARRTSTRVNFLGRTTQFSPLCQQVDIIRIRITYIIRKQVAH